MNKTILGLDLGSNSIGWALLQENSGKVSKIIDIGSRIFTKAVEEKVLTPKNQKRRDMRLGRRVLQRRARRKQKMLNYCRSLNLLPQALTHNFAQEKLLNELGNPYELRVKGLDEQLSPYELGRILLHFVTRRGFLSSKKQIAGDLIDDPDTLDYLAEIEAEEKQKTRKKEKTTKADDQSEGAYKADIAKVYQVIKDNKARTLGEYLFKLETGKVKRNRAHDGGHLRTDRAMYQQEVDAIWKKQQAFFDLPDEFMTEIEKIIFYQRPLKLKKDRIGKCSLEPKHYRAATARLEVQRFRYLQEVNNLKYFEPYTEKQIFLNNEQRQKLIIYFEHHPKITLTALKKILSLDRSTKINLEDKNLKGNISACEIRAVIDELWDNYTDKQRYNLFEDLFTIKKKSALKTRLIKHWEFDNQTAVKLCLLEFEPSHSNLSLKAIKKLLPHLEQGLLYSKKDKDTGEIGALQAAGYDELSDEIEKQNKLPAPIETANPIVNRAMQELKRLVNAIIKQHGKPNIIRIEMARDLEMNTKRYKENEARQRKNEKANEAAQEAFSELNLGKKYATRDDKIKYRLWQDQDKCCAYSNRSIALTNVFSDATEIDHILPFSITLDDSYMNKVVCFVKENREKRNQTPIDAWGGNGDKWNQITQAISRWDNDLKSKVARFYQTNADLAKQDFASNQLNDTRYISTLAQNYVRQLGSDVNVTKGGVVANIRHQWGFNDLLGEKNKKDRTDHRHHAIDAVVIGATSRRLYQQAVKQIKADEINIAPPYENIRHELKEKITNTIVSHAPQKKLSGALHEETGAGYVAKHKGLVYRKLLNSEFEMKNALKIVDAAVRNTVLEHLLNYNEDPKKAFAEEALKKLKLGKSSIKRVRVLQSAIKTTKNKTAEDILSQTKFGVRDKQGKVFKWMAYGNNHHVEIICHKDTGKIKGEFVTMMEAHRRAMTGTKSAKKRQITQEPIIKTNHGDKWEFVMVLHINDTVSIENDQGEQIYYRLQKLDAGDNRFMLRLNTASTLDNKDEKLLLTINKDTFEKYQIKLHKINAIGYFLDD